MEKVIIDFIENHMMNHIILIALCVAATIGAMAVDLVSGVQKAKQRGEARTSTGYKKTATKAKKYFTPFLTLCFIDILVAAWWFPYRCSRCCGRLTAFSASSCR